MNDAYYDNLSVERIKLVGNNKKDKLQEITDILQEGVKAVYDSDKYREYLTVMSKFHHYSFRNTLLILFQKPDASMIAGYGAWQKNFKRHVKKGEQGIKIIAPAPYKTQKKTPILDKETNLPIYDDEGKPLMNNIEVTVPAYKVATVFDISQTDGEPLPQLVDELQGNIVEYENIFNAIKHISPVPIEFENIGNGAKGYFNRVENRIAIHENMSEMQTLKTAIHEVAHAMLHDISPEELKEIPPEERKDRHTKEVEAESVAFTVCMHYGIDTSDYTFGYVAGWSSGKELPELQASLATIQKTADEIISDIDEYLTEVKKEISQKQLTENLNQTSGLSQREDDLVFSHDIKHEKEVNMKNWVSQEMVEKAMQVNLLSYAQSLGMNFMQQGDNWYLKDNKGVHSLNISASKNRYYRFSTGRGGNVIQFAQEMNGWSFQDAVRALCGEDIQKNHYNTVPQNSTEAHTPPVKEKMVLPPAHTDSRRVFTYLAKTRGIDTEIISELMKAHKIYENDKHSCVFVGYDEKGEPSYASMRSTYTQGTAFKGEVRGSSKEVPFTMKGSSDSVFVFEAPIDCMSHASIMKFAGGDWHADWRISLGGFADLGLEQFLKQHPEIKNIHFCTDNDAQGIAVLENSYNQDGSLKKAGYIKKYTDKGYNVFRDEPKNKDFNEDLQELRDMQQNIDEVEVVEEAMELG